jgi:hypothetical protein
MLFASMRMPLPLNARMNGPRTVLPNSDRYPAFHAAAEHE